MYVKAAVRKEKYYYIIYTMRGGKWKAMLLYNEKERKKEAAVAVYVYSNLSSSLISMYGKYSAIQQWNSMSLKGDSYLCGKQWYRREMSVSLNNGNLYTMWY